MNKTTSESANKQTKRKKSLEEANSWFFKDKSPTASKSSSQSSLDEDLKKKNQESPCHKLSRLKLDKTRTSIIENETDVDIMNTSADKKSYVSQKESVGKYVAAANVKAEENLKKANVKKEVVTKGPKSVKKEATINDANVKKGPTKKEANVKKKDNVKQEAKVKSPQNVKIETSVVKAIRRKSDESTDSCVPSKRSKGSSVSNRLSQKSKEDKHVVKSNVSALQSSLNKLRNEPPKRISRSTKKSSETTEKQNSDKLLKEKGTVPDKAPSSRSSKKSNEKEKSKGSSISDIKISEDVNDDDDDDDSDDDDDDDWEEVEDLDPAEIERKIKAQLPDKPIQITIDMPNPLKKKRKGSMVVQEYFRLQLNRFRKETQENLHKVHLICLLAHGQYINKLCCDKNLQALTLSRVPVEFSSLNISTNKWSVAVLTRFVKWFAELYSVDSTIKSTSKCERIDEIEEIEVAISSCKVKSDKQHAQLFVITCRSLGFKTRLVYSLQPVTFKASDLKPKTKKEKQESDGIVKEESEKENKSKKSSGNQKQKTVVNAKKKPTSSKESKIKNTRRREHSSKVNYAEESEDENNDDDDVKKSAKKNLKKFKRGAAASESSDEDFDFDEEKSFRCSSIESKQKPKGRTQRRSSSKTQNSVNDDNDEPRTGSDWWVEVFLEMETKWICVHSVRKEVNSPIKIGSLATSPISYILAYDNDDHIKDVTMRYASDWLTMTQKLRLSNDWWNLALDPYQSLHVERETLENIQLQDNLMKKPLPTSISEYKSHPLYALRRHLLKFEAIYPPDAPALGYVRGDAVYSRDCVHLLHAKEKWRLEGRLVRLDEEPYKIVRARPKVNKPKEYNDNLKLPLYGRWQTEQYIPYPASNGIVPKNEYGNVELFQPWMLPGGTVYLPDTLPGLGKVAKKINIDVAPAMTGWEFHMGFNVPMHSGWVVCEENKDILLAAYDEEMEIKREKDREKRVEKILENWKTLVRGLLIRERLKKRFNLQSHPEPLMKDKSSTSKVSAESSGEKGGVACWPENIRAKKIQTLEDMDSSDEENNLFPFEKNNT